MRKRSPIQSKAGADLGALEIELSRETLTEIDTIFPGFKTAPEDYAW